MPKQVDLSGKQFGKLTVVSFSNGRWFCQCECGGDTSVRAGHLNAGNVGSCGQCRAEERHCDYCGKIFNEWRPSRPWYCKKRCYWEAKKRPAEDRFFEKVDKESSKHSWNGTKCWEWVGSMNHNGYGQFAPHHGEAPQGAHRFAWILEKGVIRDPQIKVLHHCDNPPCVRLEHLFVGTTLDNMRDKIAKGRLRVPFGSEHWKSKLNEDNVRDIKRRLALGHTQAAIAASHDIDPSVISFINTGKYWKHV